MKQCDLPIPITTNPPVTNFPKSSSAFPAPSPPKSSGFASRPQIKFGKGASTYVATTRSGRYCLSRAQERMTRRKPRASTWEVLVLGAGGLVAQKRKGGPGSRRMKRRRRWVRTYEGERNDGLETSRHPESRHFGGIARGCPCMILFLSSQI